MRLLIKARKRQIDSDVVNHEYREVFKLTMIFSSHHSRVATKSWDENTRIAWIMNR
jgi:hypothetical protein